MGVLPGLGVLRRRVAARAARRVGTRASRWVATRASRWVATRASRWVGIGAALGVLVRAALRLPALRLASPIWVLAIRIRSVGVLTVGAAGRSRHC